MPRRVPQYSSLDGARTERETVPWYWRAVAFAASWLILGGWLTLPPQFNNDANLRLNKNGLAIFSIAMLTAGISLTGLLCFAVSSKVFHADAVFLPALSSCALGLLTAVYCFLLSGSYTWNTASLLTTVFAALTTIVYGALLFWTHRGLSMLKPSTTNPPHIPLHRPTSSGFENPAYQDTAYYRNYNANMYPTSRGRPEAGVPVASPPPDAVLTEDELTRQQMLMLLLNKPESAPSPEPPHNNSYRIEWNQDDVMSPAPAQAQGAAPPYNGWYAPQPAQQIVSPQPFSPPSYQSHLQPPTNGPVTPGYFERPWDGVWRTMPGERSHSTSTTTTAATRRPSQGVLHPALRDPRFVRRSPSREERRREIERGA